MRYKIFFLCTLMLFGFMVARIDRVFFKRSNSFSTNFIFSSLPNAPEWDLPPPSEEELRELDPIFKQSFHYLGRGSHCYAFISDDQKYVIKFHRFASHMRLFPWTRHPFSYRLNQERKKIKQHNIEKLRYNLQNYKNSYLNLKKEAGILFLHINKTDTLRRTVTLVDKTHARHFIPLDEVTFILQKKGDLLYPTLDKLTTEKKVDEAKAVITHLIQLMVADCQKGFIDRDPVLRKNYGFLADCAIHIDLGDLVKDEEVKKKENQLPYVKERTESLRKRLEENYPELLTHYYEEINRL